MNDQQLAEKLVEHGIGERRESAPGHSHRYVVPTTDGRIVGTYSAEQFVHDWRVAGKCLEEMTVAHTERFSERGQRMVILNESGEMNGHVEVTDKNLPRAICLAYAEAKG